MKISLAAENERTVFQKLREAALAYHLTRQWSKEQILRNYLNSIYFGNGAYGIESAARTYFPYNHDGCGDERPADVRVGAAAARGRAAGRRWSPRRARYDPIQHPGRGQAPARPRAAAHVRAGLPHAPLYDEREGRRTAPDARRPDRSRRRTRTTRTSRPGSSSRSSTSSAAARQGAQRAFEGGLQVKTTIDSRLQKAAENAIKAWLPNARRPARVAGRDLQQRRHGAGDGRRRQLRRRRRSTSPPRASASPARRSSRSCSPRRCARASARSRRGSRRSGPTSSRAASASRSTTTRTPTRA